jgi:hypothetical protein
VRRRARAATSSRALRRCSTRSAACAGGPYAVDEAFCVIFRRDGPYYDLTSVLQTETYRLHLVLIDLAPTTDAGRQKEKPMLIGAEEFFAAETQADEGPTRGGSG